MDMLNFDFVFVVFISWDIGHYLYRNYLFASLWRHKFSN